MPIKGRSEKRRLARVGKVHLGVKQVNKNGKEYPKAVDYFVVHADATTSEPAAAAFREEYGQEPRELDIVFPSDNQLDWGDQWYKMYGASWGLLCRGDGEVAQAKWDPMSDGPRPAGVPGGSWAHGASQTWVSMQIPCLAAECPMQMGEPPACKAVMNLQFMLPTVRGIGVWQVDTGSFHSIQNVTDNVETIKAVTGGRIRGIPLKLRLMPKEVVPLGGKVKKKTVWVLDISLPDMGLYDLLRAAQQLPENMLMLPPPPDDEEVPEDLFPAVSEPVYERPEGSPRAVASAQQANNVSPDTEVDSPDGPFEVVAQEATQGGEAAISPASYAGDAGASPAPATKTSALRGLKMAHLGDVLTAAWRHFHLPKAEVETICGELLARGEPEADGVRSVSYDEVWQKLCDVGEQRASENGPGLAHRLIN